MMRFLTICYATTLALGLLGCGDIQPTSGGGANVASSTLSSETAQQLLERQLFAGCAGPKSRADVSNGVARWGWEEYHVNRNENAAGTALARQVRAAWDQAKADPRYRVVASSRDAETIAFDYDGIPVHTTMVTFRRSFDGVEHVYIYACHGPAQVTVLDVTPNPDNPKQATVVYTVDFSAGDPAWPPLVTPDGLLTGHEGLVSYRSFSPPSRQQLTARFQRLDATGWQLN